MYFKALFTKVLSQLNPTYIISPNISKSNVFLAKIRKKSFNKKQKQGLQ